MSERKHLLHIKSSQTVTQSDISSKWLKGAVLIGGNYVTPKLPTDEDLLEGELAINYAAGVETISHKNSDGDIVTYPNMNIIEEKEEIVAAALAKHEEDINSMSEGQDDNEEVIAASINAIVGQSTSGSTITSDMSLSQLRSELTDLEESVDIIDEVTANAVVKIVGGSVETLADDESLGAVNKSVNTIDEVTAATIVEIYNKIDDIDSRVTTLETNYATLSSNYTSLEARVSALES